MSDALEFSLTLTQEHDYAFRIAFDDTAIPSLLTDEPPPIGGDAGPNPSRLLVAAVANCLGASLLFALRKYKNTPMAIRVHAKARMARNEQGRLRVGHVAVTIDLPDAAADYHQFERLLAQFENFCVVTESVRHGVPVDVTVRDAAGVVVHEGGAAS